MSAPKLLSTATSRHDASGEERAILLALAEAEGRHEAHWLELLGPHAARVPAVSLRTRILAFFARRFGSVFVLALAQRAESRSPYERDADATPAMAADERIHGEVVRGLAARGRQRLAGSFRAAVFGANDGLVSNLALVLGIGATGVAMGRCCSRASRGSWRVHSPWRRASSCRCARSANCSPPPPPTLRRTRRSQTSTSTRTSSRSSIARAA